MLSGFNGMDFEKNVNYERLHIERRERARKLLRKDGLGSMLCFDYDNIRYITGTHLGEWARNKMFRHCLFIESEEQPFLFDPAAASKRQRVDWMDPSHINPAFTSMRGTVPKEVGVIEEQARMIIDLLKEYGADKKPIGIDIIDIPLARALERAGLELVDGQVTMQDARIIKTFDEIQLLKCSAAIVDAAYVEVAKFLKPGVTENQLVGLVNKVCFDMGADHVEFVNAISGMRGNPHSHTFSNRMCRPGELVYMDIGNSFNGYKTCYYRTFSCGKPTPAQEKAYEKALRDLRASAAVLKPGATTADIASKWATGEEIGMKNEREAFAVNVGHGIGLGLHEKPFISRLFSLDHPVTLEEGMVFALETWEPAADMTGGVRIEEEYVITKDGYECITKFPSDTITSCGLHGCMYY